MTREELEKRLNEAEKQNLRLIDEIKALKEQLANVESEPEIPNFPIFDPAGEEAWHINNVLEVASPGRTSGHVCDFNYFHTKTYAKEFSRKCKMIAMMMHCSWYVDRFYTPDWNNMSVEKYSVSFNHDRRKFQVQEWYYAENAGVYFSTKEAAKKCADWMNEHWVN